MPSASPTQYEHRTVAFVDILGWKDAVERSTREPIFLEALLSALTQLEFRSFDRRVHDDLLPYVPDSQLAVRTQVSDCLVISRPEYHFKNTIVLEVLDLSISQPTEHRTPRD